jgi:hypothetical protein
MSYRALKDQSYKLKFFMYSPITKKIDVKQI